jgi:hypothetical protein
VAALSQIFKEREREKKGLTSLVQPRAHIGPLHNAAATLIIPTRYIVQQLKLNFFFFLSLLLYYYCYYFETTTTTTTTTSTIILVISFETYLNTVCSLYNFHVIKIYKQPTTAGIWHQHPSIISYYMVN